MGGTAGFSEALTFLPPLEVSFIDTSVELKAKPLPSPLVPKSNPLDCTTVGTEESAGFFKLLAEFAETESEESERGTVGIAA